MAVARVIEERLGPAATTADRFTHYERGGRPLAEWRDHLAQAMNQASYRHNAATVDEAATVLRSAQATPEQRVGAALAMRVAGQPKERIRVAVDAAADDRVRAGARGGRRRARRRGRRSGDRESATAAAEAVSDLALLGCAIRANTAA